MQFTSAFVRQCIFLGLILVPTFAVASDLTEAELNFTPSPPADPSLFGPDAPAQLNEQGFAYCLTQEAPTVDTRQFRADYQLNEFDLLLVYLSVYPGRRLPALAPLIQDPAHRRWTVAFEARERSLAESLQQRALRFPPKGKLAPAAFFRDALSACDGNAFCAALISHNVLRTLGRHEQAIYRDPISREPHDLNPPWFLENRDTWLTQIPLMQDILMSLRPDTKGDGWGEWYHFFGILTFSLHEMALRSQMLNVDFVVRLNELLNPLLAGGAEGAEKARLDRDSVTVSWLFLHQSSVNSPATSCEDRASYVRTN